MSNSQPQVFESKILIAAYTNVVFIDAARINRDTLTNDFSRLSLKDSNFLQNIRRMASATEIYNNNSALDKALDSIDLGKIYAGVEEKEKQASEESSCKMGYQDFIVMQLLQYFKRDFFSWFDKPKCNNCEAGEEKIEFSGAVRPKSQMPGNCGLIEQFICKSCGSHYEFPRYNDPVKLLETRSGRCGEWVNCFLLLLRALLGTKGQIRYVWNAEDHVWCEYYSKAQGRWIHLDPCEGVYDEPSLYESNWGKKMSWCLGYGDSYIIDLSEKYITNDERRIPKKTVMSEPNAVGKYIKELNKKKLLRYFNLEYRILDIPKREQLIQFYFDVLLIMNREIKSLKGNIHEENKSNLTTKGRQNGSSEWVKSRGEDGA